MTFFNENIELKWRKLKYPPTVVQNPLGLDILSGFLSPSGDFYFAHFNDHTNTAKAIAEHFDMPLGLLRSGWMSVRQRYGEILMFHWREITPPQNRFIRSISRKYKGVDVFRDLY